MMLISISVHLVNPLLISYSTSVRLLQVLCPSDVTVSPTQSSSFSQNILLGDKIWSHSNVTGSIRGNFIPASSIYIRIHKK